VNLSLTISILYKFWRYLLIRKIALLRGINVGGRRKILMADLKSLFEKMNFSNIKTYIQSGNIIFDVQRETDTTQLSQNIRRAIKNEFGYDVPVIVRTPEELESALLQHPFSGQTTNHTQLHVTFLSEEPSKENCKKLESYDVKPDKFLIRKKDVFLYCEGKYHTSKLTNDFIEKKLNVNATTRNWRTLKKLAELSEKEMNTN